MSGGAPWDATLAWFLQSSAADMGLRSSFASVLARLEGSSAGPSADSTWPTYDPADVKRLRRVEPLWRRLTPGSRRTLEAHYGTRPLPPRMDARLGRLSRVAMSLAHEDGRLGDLLRACESGTAKVLSEYRRRASDAALAAHREYWEARDAA